MGKVVLVFVLLLLVLGFGGYYNYSKNAGLDKELENRTNAGLSDADLDALIAAYGGEIDANAAYVSDKPMGTDLMNGIAAGDYHTKVKNFEKFQGYNKDWKRARGQQLERKVALDEFLREKSIRARGLDKEYNRIWRRVSTF